jgi:hypothetical protein
MLSLVKRLFDYIYGEDGLVYGRPDILSEIECGLKKPIKNDHTCIYNGNVG